MSELAFDANGEPLTFPASAEELRVRLFRNPGMRGACEVVHDKEGGALYVPIDTTYLEFRQRVDGVPGRYRLDPVDAQRKVLSNASPAYCTISAATRNAAGGGVADERDSLIRELVRANVEMATAISDRFANVMDRFANVVEVAVGSKQARLEPTQPSRVTSDAGADDEDDEPDQDATLETARTIERIANKGLEAFNKWLVSRSMRPAPAASPTPAPAAASAPTPPADVPPSPASATTTATSAGPSEPRNTVAAAAPTAEQLAHLTAIRDALDPEERTVCDVVVMKMNEAQRAEWLVALCAMTVDQAVAQVRALMPPLRRRKTAEPSTPTDRDRKEPSS